VGAVTALEPRPALSIVIPVYNEAATLIDLHARLSRVLKELDRAYEIVFVDDGSADGSFEVMRTLREQDRAVRVVRFTRNYGQHAAVFAGMQRARGDVVVTLDADLQNPPEQIPRLLAHLVDGVEVVSGRRVARQDPLLRRVASRLVNRLTSRIVGVKLHDYGCMLRVYRRVVVDRILACQEIPRFIPAMATALASKVVEVPVEHHTRREGTSKYGLLGLLRLNFDLVTGFSLLPIQVVSVAGMLVAVLGLAFGVFLFIRRLFVGPEVEGVFTLFAILFFFVGLQILALGLIGEYVGRIYQEVRRRPQYLVAEELE
jgi:undecaprenyl-phosphate 4-deoxy-4-formamido-L-arabinose transferase